MTEFVALILSEAVVSQAVERITHLLVHETTSLSSVRDDVQSLRTELMRIKCFLEDADHKKEQDKRMQNWVAEVRDVAFEIEDAIETYIYKLNSSNVITRACHLRRLRTEICNMEDKLSSIGESRQTYQIEFGSGGEGGSNTNLRNLRRWSPNDCEEDDVVNMMDISIALMTQLMEEKDRLCVVSIVGMGGLGKTTLAKKVYNDRDVKQHFDCYAWVSISQQYESRYVLSEILIQVGFFQSGHDTRNDLDKKHKIELLEERGKEREILAKYTEKELISSIKDELHGKRYLVVLDDIWRNEDWDSIKSAFPKGKKGSKVVFTTRIKEVASYADPMSLPIEPPFLTSEESWELLRRKAFPKDVYGERGCTSKLELLGKEIVEKCGGLPGAIVVLGGLLRTKTLSEWEKVQRDVNSHLKHKFGVEEMLALSYHDLPFYLKPCFLYLCSFPRDDLEISRRKLIRLWIAEGFIITPTTSRETMKEIAEEYLRELIDRCMIQVGKRDYSEAGIKTCRLHDLMRDFCVSKAREENFSEVIQQNEKHTTTASSLDPHFMCTTRPRRIVVHRGCNLDTNQIHPHLRSLLCFDVSSHSLVEYVKSKNLRLLRVLEVRFSRGKLEYCKVPKEIGNLIHLRYLGMRDADKVKLPRSIGNLRSLRILNLRDNNEVTLPSTILRLTRLRYLLLPFDTCIPHRSSWSFQSASSDLKHIQILKYVKFGPLLVRKRNTKAELRSLQDLGIQFKSKEEVEVVLEYPNFEFSNLQSLHLSMLSSNTFPNLQPLSQCQILSRLFLDGMILSHSRNHSLEFLPTSLTKLVLKDSSIGPEDPMEFLEKLQNLKFLRLHNSYSGSEMVCSSQGFPRLETLQLFSLKEVTEWRVLENALPNLKRLHIKDMPELKAIPEGLRYIAYLKELKISDMTRSFEDRLRVKYGVEGADFYKVRHVSSISFSWTLSSR